MKIYKYEIEIKDRFQLILPEKSRILSVQLRYDVPMLWALVDPDNYTIPYFFSAYGTGDKMDENLYHKYICTLAMNPYVWHLFQIAHIDVVGKLEDLDKFGYF